MCGMLKFWSMRSSRGTHLALCGCNEHEQAVDPVVGADQGRPQCVFSLWPLLDLSGTRPGMEVVIQDQSYVTPCRWPELGSAGSWHPLPLHMNPWHWNHWKLVVTYIVYLSKLQLYRTELLSLLVKRCFQVTAVFSKNTLKTCCTVLSK